MESKSVIATSADTIAPEDKQRSKFISRLLRHRAKSMGVPIDKHGWVSTSDLLSKAAESGLLLNKDDLRRVVANSDKQRFDLSEDESRIRANQGHSIEGIDLQLPIKKPPPVLYHGTGELRLSSIRKEGLTPQNRHDVHLSPSRETAWEVGARRDKARHSKPAVLVIETFPMVRDGFQFKVSKNGVWLVSSVPAKYIRFPD